MSDYFSWHNPLDVVMIIVCVLIVACGFGLAFAMILEVL